MYVEYVVIYHKITKNKKLTNCCFILDKNVFGNLPIFNTVFAILTSKIGRNNRRKIMTVYFRVLWFYSNIPGKYTNDALICT